MTTYKEQFKKEKENKSAFDTWSSSGVEERQKIIKEEGSTEEDKHKVEVKQC